MPRTVTPNAQGILEFTETVTDEDGDVITLQSVELNKIDNAVQSGADRNPSWLSWNVQDSTLADGTTKKEVKVDVAKSGLQQNTDYELEFVATDGQATVPYYVLLCVGSGFKYSRLAFAADELGGTFYICFLDPETLDPLSCGSLGSEDDIRIYLYEGEEKRVYYHRSIVDNRGYIDLDTFTLNTILESANLPYNIYDFLYSTDTQNDFYYEDPNNDTLYKSDINGNITQILNSGQDYRDVWVDIDYGKIFYGIRDTGDAAIWQSNLDGSNFERLVYMRNFSPSDDFGYPTGLAGHRQRQEIYVIFRQRMMNDIDVVTYGGVRDRFVVNGATGEYIDIVCDEQRNLLYALSDDEDTSYSVDVYDVETKSLITSKVIDTQEYPDQNGNIITPFRDVTSITLVV